MLIYHHPPKKSIMLSKCNDDGGDHVDGDNGNAEQQEKDSLGPLPLRWEKAFTENGETYFIDHNTGTSHWLDPRLSKFQKKSLEDCLDDELPYGWEKIHDSQYGTYFIDHVNRRTQYENPVLEAKRRAERDPPDEILGKSPNGKQLIASSLVLTEIPGGHIGSTYLKLNDTVENIFTRNPSELCGDRITTTLLKSSRGLGFTIVGGDDTVEEFLQIKSIVPNGPAWLNGKIKTGDILVYVNEICVLGFTHHEMVNVFQSILAGETVTLEVCRGYPLPFDPDDTNTDIITTIAVDNIINDVYRNENVRLLMGSKVNGNYNLLNMFAPNEIHPIDQNNNNMVHYNNDNHNNIDSDNDKGNGNNQDNGNGKDKENDKDNGNHSYDDNYNTDTNHNNDDNNINYTKVKYNDDNDSNSSSSNNNNNHNNKYVHKDGNLTNNVMPEFQNQQSKNSDAANYSNDVKHVIAMNKPEILNIRIAKGSLGFGFTIADSAYGQKVKKILERNCCKNLLEGDYLLAINNISLNQMSHTEVVQVLKDCPKCQEAIFKVQRGQYFNSSIFGSNGKNNRLRRSGDATRFGIHTKTNSVLPPINPPTSSDIYRSKTPIVGFYNTQQKDIIPGIPGKTPIVDNQNRIKSPIMIDIESTQIKTSKIVPSTTANINDIDSNSMECMDKNFDGKIIQSDNQSNTSFHDYDYMNNDIPCMAPLSNVIPSLKDKFCELSIHTTQGHLQDRYVDSRLNNLCHPIENLRNGPYIGSINNRSDIYYDEYKQQHQRNYALSNHNNNSHLSVLASPSATLPIIAPVPTYYQDCFCCDCQECYRRLQGNQDRKSLQSQNPITAPQLSATGATNKLTNRDMQNRITDYMIDRRKTGFCPLEIEHGGGGSICSDQTQSQLIPIGSMEHSLQRHYWKCDQLSPNSGNDSLTRSILPQEEYAFSDNTLKQQTLGFGFRGLGGTEQGAQLPIVGQFVPGGSTDCDIGITTGD